MSNTIALADRMRRYENIPKNFLMRRTPVILRLDGAHFKNFTRTLDKPFDGVLTRAMEGTYSIFVKLFKAAYLDIHNQTK
jgi:tRNA(His) 5'-end guanylyltransferase